MTQGLYFSCAEFMVLLELSGNATCFFLKGSDEPDDERLIQAFAGLFQRGMIRRYGDSFAVEDSGKGFLHMHSAPIVTVVSWWLPEPGRAMCYVEDDIWLVELVDVIVTQQYRVRQLNQEQLPQWFFETGLLEPPVLTQQDTRERDIDLDGVCRNEPFGNRLLLLEKYRNGGECLVSYEVIQHNGERLVCTCGENGRRIASYTKEALSQMLAGLLWRGEP